MDLPALPLLLIGLALLVGGGALLVRSASRLALAWGVSPLVVGLTVVAMGTSAPEMAVSVIASVEGRPSVALGNVVGSNIFNVLGILGLSAAITPLVVSRTFVRREIPVLIGLGLLTWALAGDGRFEAWAGALFVALLAAGILWTVRASRREVAPPPADPATPRPVRWWAEGLLALLALALLVAGSQWFVEGAVDLARSWGMSELAIGLLLVAPGTSLPELVTSAVAALRGQRDIAVANVVGSNLFNLLGVLGLSAWVGGGIEVSPEALRLDLPVMLASSVLLVPIVVTGHRIHRAEGVLLMAWFGAYVTWLLLAESAAGPPRTLVVGLLGFALPLTLLGLGLSLWHARRGA